MKYALVTGGCGFVGKYFCKRLLNEDYCVLCVDSLVSESSSHPNSWPSHLFCVCKQFEFLHVDVRDFFTLPYYVNRKYDLIIHLAAIVGGRVNIENNPLAVAEDLSIDADFFKFLSMMPVKPGKVVYFSSSAAYPIEFQRNDDIQLKLRENMIDFSKNIGVPDYTYGMSKLIGEYLAKIAHEKYGINIVCYRPFSGYGETQHEAYPFIAILKRFMRKENPVEIWSNTTRDFVYIDDIVDCVFKTKDKISDGSAVNIGSGEGISFLHLAKKMETITGQKSHIKILRNKPVGVEYRVADICIVNSLGWKPTTSLEIGISKCLDYVIDEELKL